MGKINWGRVVLGGLVAGVVSNLLQFVACELYLVPALNDATLKLGRSLGEITNVILAFWAVLSFALGVITVWFYAAIRPRYGPGPKTAAIAGCAIWALAVLLPVVGWGSLGALPSFPLSFLALHLGTYLVIAIAAAEAGARIYRE